MNASGPVSKAEAHLSAEGSDVLRSLGNALRAARTAQGVSRREMAGRLLIGMQTLRRMEIGDPRVSFGYYLAAAERLGVQFVDVQGLLRLTSTLRHSTGRALRKARETDRFS